MDTTNPEMMPIALVKETPGSVLVNVELKRCLPDNIYFKPTFKNFRIEEGQSKTVWKMKSRIPTHLRQDVTIVLDLSVLPHVPQI